MAYFPMFVSLEEKRAVLFGGGRVAARKAEKLKPFGCRISVYAREFSQQLQTDGELLHVCELDEMQIGEVLEREQPVLAVAALNDRELNRLAGRLCRERSIPVNVADSKEESTFLFPALAMSGDIVAGVNCAGKAPYYTRALRKSVQELLPENGDAVLEALESRRAKVREWLRVLPPEEAEAKIMALIEETKNSAGK